MTERAFHGEEGSTTVSSDAAVLEEAASARPNERRRAKKRERSGRIEVEAEGRKTAKERMKKANERETHIPSTRSQQIGRDHQRNGIRLTLR
jgi:hypothetical protein